MHTLLILQLLIVATVGLHPADIVSGYQKAAKKVLEFLEGKQTRNGIPNSITFIHTTFAAPELTVHKIENPRDEKQVAHCLKTVLSAKQ